MADNENKIVLNVPGQADVDPSEVTHEALTLKDPLSGRDTDTGSLDRMDDTKTRKTVKIKPVIGSAPVPVISLGATASVRIAPAAPADVPTESARLKDVLSNRDTDTGSLDRMDDTKTRKTVKLSPISSGSGPVPVMKLGTVAAPAINTESIPITTLPHPVSPAEDDTRTRQTVVLKTPPAPAINTESIPITTLPHPVSPAEDDTRTRQTVVLKTPPAPAINTESIPITTLPHPVSPAEDDTRTRQTVVLKTPSAPAAAVGTESAPLSDVLAGRDTDTGNMERMDDTKTRKTIKLTPLAAGGPISKLAPLGKSAGAPAPVVLPRPAAPPVNLAATVELKPVSIPVVPKPAAPPVINLAATVELKPVVLPVPGQGTPVSTDTGSLKNILEDTSTRKTVKLQPLPASGATVAPAAIDLEKTVVSPTVPQPVQVAAAQPPDAEPMVSETSDDTVKLHKTHVPSPAPVAHEVSSPLPTVAQAKTVVPGSKQTIKLRPSTGGGTAPPEEPVAAMAVKSVAGSSKDTIKISPLSTNGAPAAGVAPSSPTLNLATKLPTPAPAGVVPSSPTVNLSAPSGLTLKKPTLTPAPMTPPVSAPAAAPEQKPGLSLPGKAAVKPPEPAAAEEPPVVEEAAMDATDVDVEETPVEEKKGGLQLKKRDAGDEPQGPPRVQTDLEKIEGSAAVVSIEGQPSMLYFVLALVSVICLAASTYIAAAQYVNYWQQAKVKSKLPVSFLSQFMK